MSMTNLSNEPKVTVQQASSFEEWKSYVTAHSSSTIYHLPEWSRVLEENFCYQPFHLFARNEEGKLCGILPLLLIKSTLTGNRLVSLPFSYLCGPTTDSDYALMSLLGEAKRLFETLKCHYLEIKVMQNREHPTPDSLWLQNGFVVSEQFSTFILELSQPDMVWKKLDPKSVRWAVRRAKKDGVMVRKGNSVQDIESFYRLNLKTKKRIGVPGHPENLFLSMFEKLGDRCILYLAEFQSEIIAGIITMKFDDTVLYGYGASNDNYRMHQPNNLLVWTAIEDSCQEGYSFFDFGRTSPAEQGVTSFKRHWGTEERMLSYYYYPHIPNSMSLNDTGLKYKLATSLWKKMPLPLAQVCSNMIFKHLG